MTAADDRRRWNARYEAAAPTFEPHPLVAEALAAGLPDGPVLELACGPSGSALVLAETGREVVAVDVSDVALAQLAAESRRRGLGVRCVEADVPSYRPQRRFALVLATRYWDASAFRVACAAVRPGGLLGWEALADRDAIGSRRWHVRHGELGERLPAGFTVLTEDYLDTGGRATSRLLARLTGGP